MADRHRLRHARLEPGRCSRSVQGQHHLHDRLPRDRSFRRGRRHHLLVLHLAEVRERCHDDQQRRLLSLRSVGMGGPSGPPIVSFGGWSPPGPSDLLGDNRAAMSDERPNASLPPRWLPAVVLGLVAVCYLPTLRAGFVWDDIPLVVQNQITGDLKNLPRFFQEDLWAATPGQDGGTGYYRPLMLLSLALDRAIFDSGPVGTTCTIGMASLRHSWPDGIGPAPARALGSGGRGQPVCIPCNPRPSFGSRHATIPWRLRLDLGARTCDSPRRWTRAPSAWHSC